ncbi:uncharacterized protein FA14DRAFT_116065, partial [Meira miltonrushii]
FEILPQFRIDSNLRGDVLIRCSDCDFYVHKAVLYFASPFFRAILDGDWKETHPSLHTISSSESSVDSALTRSEDEEQTDNSPVEADKAEKQTNTEPGSDTIKEAERRNDATRSQRLQKRDQNLVAVIDLTEEDAATFQDFLCHVYPNLDLIVTWINIFPLFAFSDKFEVPFLRRACTTFLRASLAGRPIDAMALSERHGIEDVYREASRHVLDNMPSWAQEELDVLSQETLLKLERKRTWFLERLLKLGLANPARDYECHSACPDPQQCAKLLDVRWHSQYAAAFKYGPPQPSIIMRHLRELDGNGAHSQSMTMLACQSSSKAWVQSLFDRMYGL